MAANAAAAETDPPSASILYSKDEMKISTAKKTRRRKYLRDDIRIEFFFYMKGNFYFVAAKAR